MTIIFVGIHNKIGKEPLCSSTKSGKLIDRIIKELDKRWITGEWWLKTNLYNLEYLPNEEVKKKESVRFYYRIHSDDDDIFVLLGSEVAKNFFNKEACNFVEIHHPASKRSKQDMNDYVLSSVKQINNKINMVDANNS